MADTFDRLQIVAATDDDTLAAAHAVLVLAGEHMHRAQALDHWWPFPPVGTFIERFADRDTVIATLDDVLVATWNTSTLPEPYHDLSVWPEPEARALFLSAFAVLPSAWGLGIGRAALEHVLATARAHAHDRIRFDAVTSNRRLVAWYEDCGFTVVGEQEALRGVTVTCFERLV